MKLFRYGQPGTEKPGIEVDGIKYDTSHLVDDYNETFFKSGGLQNAYNLILTLLRLQ